MVYKYQMLDKYQKYNGIVQFNSIIPNAFPEYNFFPSILQHGFKPDHSWILALPKVIDQKGIVLHAQDHLTVYEDGKVAELIEIEEFYNDTNIDIVVVHWDHNLKHLYKGPIKLVEFPTHSFDFVQNFKNQYSEWKHVNNKTHTSKFMCLNGRLRRHRVDIYNYLKNLYTDAIVSISSEPNDYGIPLYKDYSFDNVKNFIELAHLYQMCSVNIVTETLYYQPTGILSEKLLQAFASLQLPIIIAYKGAVADARRYGFDTFDDIIDTSYDNMPNEVRWKAAIDSNSHILDNKFNYQELLPRLKRNQEYLLNGYLDLLVSNFLSQSTEVLQGTN